MSCELRRYLIRQGPRDLFLRISKQSRRDGAQSSSAFFADRVRSFNLVRGYGTARRKKLMGREVAEVAVCYKRAQREI